MKYEITKEQILRIHEHGTTIVKDWFPEAFELELNKWYKWSGQNPTIGFVIGKAKERDCYVFGYNVKGVCQEKGNFYDSLHKSNLTEATESEVFEALKKEAVKRGYRNGNHKCLNSCITEKNVKDNYILDNGYLWYGTNESANCVFQKGKWAEIIPTITKEEAEKQLGKKIID